MFSRRARPEEVADEVAARYPGADPGLVAELVGRPPRSGSRLTAWVHDQVRAVAVRRAAEAAGLDREPFPADGEDALRVYLPDGLADLPTADVPAAAWAQARDEAWGDHPDGLADDRTAEWSERLADDVERTLTAWRSGR